MAKIPVQILADPTASTWLSLSASDGADGLSLSLEHDVPIDVQLTRLVAERRNLRNSFGMAGGGGADMSHHVNAAMMDASSSLPPPSTLGVVAFSRSPASTDLLRKLNYKNALPKRRALGLDSLLLFSSTLLPGVDKTASTSGSSEELAAYLNASGMEASPWQIVHAGTTPSDYAAVSGYSSCSSSSSGPTAAKEEEEAPAGGDADAPPPPPPEEDGNGEEDPERKKPEDGAEAEHQKKAQDEVAAPPTPGRITLILVGDLLSYCHQGIFGMVASMVRPFRDAAPKVVEPSLLAYCAQESVIVAGSLRVSRDGCSVWRPRSEAAASKRHSSMIHKSTNAAIEASLPVPSYENGCAVFVNHAMGPANHVPTAAAASGTGCAFRRVFRITWTDAFHGAEHGGPEGRKRFSAPCVAIGVLHASQALQALRQAEHSHVFGRMRDSVMWCMSPDAALFPGPHLSAVHGPSFQAQPHLYVPNPLLANQIRSTSSNNNTHAATSNSNIIAASVSGSKSRSDFASALTSHRQATHGAAATHNPTVISTTVTILCDPSMQAVTFLNNGRRVASWDLSAIWAMKQGGGGGGDGQSHFDDGDAPLVDLTSVFYPVIDIGSAGTIVEVIC